MKKYFTLSSLVMLFFVQATVYGQTEVVADKQSTIVADSIISDSLDLGLHYSFHLDGYYHVNSFKKPTNTYLLLNHNMPGFGSINAIVSYDKKNWGAAINLAYGPRADQFYNVDNNEILRYVKQAYVYYDVVKDVKLQLGTSSHFVGFEFDEGYRNPVFSTSYINSLAPATMTGLTAEWSVNNHWIVNIGGIAPIDSKLLDINTLNPSLFVSHTGEKFNNSMGFSIDENKYYLDWMGDYTYDDKNSFAVEVMHFNDY